MHFIEVLITWNLDSFYECTFLCISSVAGNFLTGQDTSTWPECTHERAPGVPYTVAVILNTLAAIMQ